MKKLLAILLVFTCALSLTSCLDGLSEDIGDMLKKWEAQLTTTTDWSGMTVTTTKSINPEKKPLVYHEHGEPVCPVPEYKEFGFFFSPTDRHLEIANNADMLNTKNPHHPPLFLINSMEDMDRFSSLFEIPEGEEPYLYDFGLMLDTRFGYDEEFFVKNSLILIFADEGSSTPDIGVNGLYAYDETLFVCVSYVSPSRVSDDMVTRYLAIPVSKELVSQFSDFDADLEYNLIEFNY